CQQDYTTPWTV
nr:immunoglobulin light chain junction region [Macaca mulatta]MPN89837.1 immunoglobulin light chain junction region [Macaca mulatta]